MDPSPDFSTPASPVRAVFPAKSGRSPSDKTHDEANGLRVDTYVVFVHGCLWKAARCALLATPLRRLGSQIDGVMQATSFAFSFDQGDYSIGEVNFGI